MNTITLPKNEYEDLRIQADLYEIVLRRLPEVRWGIETYSPKRIREFSREDLLDRKTRARVQKMTGQ